MGMDKLPLELSKEIRAERQPSKPPGHREAGSHTFRDAEIIPFIFIVLSHFKSSNKNATETFFLQAVPFCVSFVVLNFLTDDCSKSTSLRFQVLDLNIRAVYAPCPSAASPFFPSLGRRSPLQVVFSFSFTGLPIRLSPTSFPLLLSTLPAWCHHHQFPHSTFPAASSLLICFPRARKTVLHNFIRWPGGEGEQAVT